MTRSLLVAALLLAAPVGAEPPPWTERVLSGPMTFEDARALDPDALVAHGRRLFVGKFTAADGAGRPLATQADLPTARRPAARAFQRLSGPDAAACAGCHNDPVPGGSGDFAANAFTSEGLRNAEFDILDPQFSSERNTTQLFGAGLLELLAREMTAELHGQRDAALAQARESGAPATVALTAKGVAFGRLTALPDGLIDHAGVRGVDPDLVVRPFSRKGVVGSLRRFTVNAMNAHHGMQAAERFGARWTGAADHDGDGLAEELGAGDVSAVVAFQATLPPPPEAAPEDPEWARLAAQGRAAFAALGCAACHIPALPLDSLIFTDPSPYEGAGTLRAGDVGRPITIDLAASPWAAALARDAQGRWLVPLYGDLRRHVIVDAQVAAFADETLSQGFVAPDAFKTAELWGAGDSAPYGHRGDMTTLDTAIRAHGGEGRDARDAYVAADDDLRTSVIALLKALRAPE